MQPSVSGFNLLQKISMSLMGVLILLTFAGANLDALLWQSSDWLVSTVLPAVVVDLTNQERTNLSEPVLQRSVVLDEAAQMKAQDMADNQYFAHFSPSGISPWHWFKEAGYVYAYAGENLAIHFTDSDEVVEAWMNSPKHRENIVNSLYTEIGVGTAKGEYEGYKTVYVVQLFGTPAVAPVATIKSEPTLPTVLAKVTPDPVQAAQIPSEVIPKTELSINEVSTLQSETQNNPTTPVVTEASSETYTVANASVELVVDTEVSELPIVESDSLVKGVSPEAVDTVIGISSSTRDTVVLESSLIATSSGLAIANITTPNSSYAGATPAALATKPNTLLQITYMFIGTVVLTLLIVSIVMEARRLRYVQVAYGVMLLIAMGGLWFINSLLTTGAVIV